MHHTRSPLSPVNGDAPASARKLFPSLSPVSATGVTATPGSVSAATTNVNGKVWTRFLQHALRHTSLSVHSLSDLFPASRFAAVAAAVTKEPSFNVSAAPTNSPATPNSGNASFSVDEAQIAAHVVQTLSTLIEPAFPARTFVSALTRRPDNLGTVEFSLVWHLIELALLRPMGLRVGGGRDADTLSDLHDRLHFPVTRFRPAKFFDIITEVATRLSDWEPESDDYYGFERDQIALTVANLALPTPLVENVEEGKCLNDRSFILIMALLVPPLDNGVRISIAKGGPSALLTGAGAGRREEEPAATPIRRNNGAETGQQQLHQRKGSSSFSLDASSFDVSDLSMGSLSPGVTESVGSNHSPKNRLVHLASQVSSLENALLELRSDYSAQSRVLQELLVLKNSLEVQCLSLRQDLDAMRMERDDAHGRCELLDAEMLQLRQQFDEERSDLMARLEQIRAECVDQRRENEDAVALAEKSAGDLFSGIGEFEALVEEFQEHKNLLESKLMEQKVKEEQAMIAMSNVLEKERLAHADQMKALEAQISDMRSEMDGLEDAKKQVDAVLAQSKKLLEDAKGEVARAKAEQERLSEKLAEKEKYASELSIEVSQLRTEAAQAVRERDQAQGDSRLGAQKLAKLQGDVDSVIRERDQALKDAEASAAKISQFSSEATSARKGQSQAVEQATTATAKLRAAEDEVAALKADLEKHVFEQQRLTDKVVALEQASEAAESERDNLASSSKTISAQLESLRDELRVVVGERDKALIDLKKAAAEKASAAEKAVVVAKPSSPAVFKKAWVWWFVLFLCFLRAFVTPNITIHV